MEEINEFIKNELSNESLNGATKKNALLRISRDSESLSNQVRLELKKFLAVKQFALNLHFDIKKTKHKTLSNGLRKSLRLIKDFASQDFYSGFVSEVEKFIENNKYHENFARNLFSIYNEFWRKLKLDDLGENVPLAISNELHGFKEKLNVFSYYLSKVLGYRNDVKVDVFFKFFNTINLFAATCGFLRKTFFCSERVYIFAKNNIEKLKKNIDENQIDIDLNINTEDEIFAEKANFKKKYLEKLSQIDLSPSNSKDCLSMKKEMKRLFENIYRELLINIENDKHAKTLQETKLELIKKQEEHKWLSGVYGETNNKPTQGAYEAVELNKPINFQALQYDSLQQEIEDNYAIYKQGLEKGKRKNERRKFDCDKKDKLFSSLEAKESSLANELTRLNEYSNLLIEDLGNQQKQKI